MINNTKSKNSYRKPYRSNLSNAPTYRIIEERRFSNKYTNDEKNIIPSIIVGASILTFLATNSSIVGKIKGLKTYKGNK